MFFATVISIVLFTYWAYYRIVVKQEKSAWHEIEWVAALLAIFLLTLYFLLGD